MRPKIGRLIYFLLGTLKHFFKAPAATRWAYGFCMEFRMRADRDLSIAYPISASSSVYGVWPQAGLTGTAYRLAKLTAPRFGVLLMLAGVFFFV
jgi:hypothetical protein